MKVSPRNNISPGNLPTPLSSFIGRERELKEIQRLLISSRLVTLTGPGGCGKTRLAIRVAQELGGELERGAWLVELAAISDPALVPQTIASTLNIHAKSGHELTDMLIDFLSGRPVLLVIDNCEHLILACAHITETLLQKCPDLKILATSREMLGITGEIALMVPPLSLPDQQPWKNPVSVQAAVHSYEASESVQLFVTRAAAIAPGFQLTAENGSWVAEICRRLDGMPLAIELAAARVRTLSVQQIAQRLDDRFHLLTVGSRTAPLRQQTLAATLDWSYALLSDLEQKVLQGLSVFAGSATLDAVQWVCASAGDVLDALSRLVDKSLVTVTRPERGETRYHLLETIRQYAREKLSESGSAETTKDRHLNYFVGWAENAERHMGDADPTPWLSRYEVEKDNLRTALSWSQTDEKNVEVGLRLAVACAPYWTFRSHISEGRAHLSAALSHAGPKRRTSAHANVLIQAAHFAFMQSDYPAMQPLAEEALSIWRELGEAGKQGLAFTLGRLGDMATETGDYDRAKACFREALDIYRELDDTNNISFILLLFGWTLMRTGDLQQAQKYLEEAFSLSQLSGNKRMLAFSLSSLGEVAIRHGLYERAGSLLQQGLSLSRQMGDRWTLATILGSLGWTALCQHDFPGMRLNLRESLEVRLDTGDKGGIAWCLEKLAEAAYLEKQYKKSVEIYGAAAALRAPLGSVIDPADQTNYDRILSGLRAALGEDAFAAFWAEGAAMPLEEIIAGALSEPAPSSASTRTEKEKFGGLTEREREVAALIAQGKSNREIAQAMTVGVKTVETYVTRILNKLNFDSRVQIATWAVEKGLINFGG